MSVPVAQRLRAAAAALEAERISVAGLLAAHGPAAHGSLLLLMAVPCLLPIPGAGTVLGLGVMSLALAMWQGRVEAALPHRVAAMEMSRPWARRVLNMLATVHAAAARLTRRRLRALAPARARRWQGLLVGLMAFVIVLPIPFGNVLPAVALVLIGLGLVFRDGLATALGIAMAAITIVVTASALWLALDWAVDQVALRAA